MSFPLPSFPLPLCPPPTDVCPECSGWVHRLHDTAPACQREACPASDFQPWTQVPIARAGKSASVSFSLSTALQQRPQASRQANRQGQDAREHMTCAERLRALRLLKPEDELVDAQEVQLLENLRHHVLTECSGVEAPVARRQKLQKEMEDRSFKPTC